MRRALVILMAALCWAAAAAAEPARFPVPAPQILPSPGPMAAAMVPSAALPPGLQCRQAIRAAEQAAGIPTQLMAAIGRIESGRRDEHGVVHPWPWSINAEGTDHIFETKAAAIAAVRELQAKGMRSIDVGCMQVNLMFHPTAFASLDQAFDPLANARYAAKFLTQLFAQTGNWTKATANYHSATPELGEGYQRKVAAVLPEEQRRLAETPRMGATGNMWSGNVWSNNVWNSGPGAVPASQAGARPALPGGGGYMLSNKAEQARIIPAPASTAGRGLEAYRTTPIPIASHQMPRAPM